MKTFLYTISIGKFNPNGSGTKKVAKVWQVVKNKPMYIGEMTDTFVDEHQLVMQILEKAKALPKKCFARSPTTNTRIYGSATSLRDDGFADLICL